VKTTQLQFPKYENPPIIEMVCGVLFKPIDNLLAPYLGLLWEKFKPDYSSCQEVAPLAPLVESIDEKPPIDFQISDVPPLPRIWFVHGDGGIIQVQRDRFHHNWRKLKPEDEYPRYRNVIQHFRFNLSKFETFLKDNNLGTIEPLQYEMTYVNHIPQGEGWTTLNDIAKIFPDFAWEATKSRFLPELEVVNWRSSFALSDHSGRLHVTIRSATRKADQCPIMMFELTVRGIGNDRSRQAMWIWFDLAHEWIVRGFADLTSEEIQKKVWRRKS